MIEEYRGKQRGHCDDHNAQQHKQKKRHGMDSPSGQSMSIYKKTPGFGPRRLEIVIGRYWT
jgi:hypothetical protein